MYKVIFFRYIRPKNARASARAKTVAVTFLNYVKYNQLVISYKKVEFFFIDFLDLLQYRYLMSKYAKVNIKVKERNIKVKELNIDLMFRFLPIQL